MLYASLVQMIPCGQVIGKALELLMKQWYQTHPISLQLMCAQGFVIPHEMCVGLTGFQNVNSPGLNPSPRFFYSVIQCRYLEGPSGSMGVSFRLFKQ